MFFNVFCVLEGAIFVLYRFFFRFVFGIGFWSICGALLVSFWGALGSPNRSFFGLISSFFFVCFLHRFLVDFGSDLGVIFAGLGGSKSVILGIDFWIIFGCTCACACTRTPRAHTHSHTHSHTAPPCARTCARTPRDHPKRPKSGQERPKSGQDRAKSGQEQPKSANKKATVAKISRKRFGLKCSKHTQSKKQR